jgi:hypothetical protein
MLFYTFPPHIPRRNLNLPEQKMSVISTPITELFGIKHPVMLAGMNIAAGPELADAVSNAGGLGVIGGVGYTPKILRQQVRMRASGGAFGLLTRAGGIDPRGKGRAGGQVAAVWCRLVDPPGWGERAEDECELCSAPSTDVADGRRQK